MTPQELKNSILQLAIQGKLVEQRPEEGTAAELVEKILAAKNAKGAKKNSRAETQRRRGGKGGGVDGTIETTMTSGTFASLGCPASPVRPGCPVSPVSPADTPFDIPDSWEWVRLGEVVSLLSGRDLEPSEEAA